MARFVTKRVQVDAVQWDGEKFSDDPEWVQEARRKNMFLVVRRSVPGLYLFTHGMHRFVARGDWIIRHSNGEITPCAQDVFSGNYDPEPPAEAQKSSATGFGDYGQSNAQLAA